MPIYEYRCSSCGAEHDVLQKFSDPLLVTCPTCHKDALVKQLSAAGFQLKGSGWYATDFRNGSKPAAKTDDKSEGSSDAKADASADAKADAGAAKTADTKTESKAESAAATPAPAAPKPAAPKPTTSE